MKKKTQKNAVVASILALAAFMPGGYASEPVPGADGTDNHHQRRGMNGHSLKAKGVAKKVRCRRRVAKASRARNR